MTVHLDLSTIGSIGRRVERIDPMPSASVAHKPNASAVTWPKFILSCKWVHAYLSCWIKNMQKYLIEEMIIGQLKCHILSFGCIFSEFKTLVRFGENQSFVVQKLKPGLSGRQDETSRSFRVADHSNVSWQMFICVWCRNFDHFKCKRLHQSVKIFAKNAVI